MSTAQTLYYQSVDFIGVNGHLIDYKRAFDLNMEAAYGGYPDAILVMGWFYLNGCGCSENLPEAKYWYRRSARLGEPKAMFSLGEIACIEGVFETAYYWFELAHKHGHTHSLYWLGKLYWRGQGVPCNRAKSLQLIEQAAHANDSKAKRFTRFRNRRKYK